MLVRRREIVALGTLLMAAVFAQPAYGQSTIDWTSTGVGWWHLGGNWNSGFGPVPGALDTARFNQNANYVVEWTPDTGNTMTAGLEVRSGTVTFQSSGGPWQHTTSGHTSILDNGILILGNFSTSRRLDYITSGLTLDNGGRLLAEYGSQITTGSLTVGTSSATLSELAISNGSVLNSSGLGRVGVGSGAGSVVIHGMGSQWNNTQDLQFGSGGSGYLSIESAAVVTNNNAHLGFSSVGNAFVSGVGSHWNNQGYLAIGFLGAGSMTVVDGGLVSSTDGSIGQAPRSLGFAEVDGPGSTWNSSGNFFIGTEGIGNLVIEDGGLVTVGGTTIIGSSGTAALNSGGRFEFGTTSLASFSRISGSSGELAGQVTHSVFSNLSALTILQSSSLDLSEVNLRNSGTLIGTGTLLTGFSNAGSGRIDASTTSVMRFEGDSNLNEGRINSTGGIVSMAGGLTNAGGGVISNLGGQIVTEGQLINQGFITGRGEFTAFGGFVNQGSMAFSGTTDIFGSVTNEGSEIPGGGSLIVTSANATTTFYDAVTNDGEIRTSGNGNTVFFEEISGSGSFTGTGNVFFEGNVNPGNSPAVIQFGGNLTLGTGSHTLFELGGTTLNQYDRFNIAGNLTVLGSMSVAMWDNFQLNYGMSFLIADIGGTRTGLFRNASNVTLGEGALVGNFNGHDLFITYSGGSNGRGIALFTAVPEPNAWMLVFLPGLALFAFRRRMDV